MKVHEGIQEGNRVRGTTGQFRTLTHRKGRGKCANERSCVTQTLTKRGSLPHFWVSVTVPSYEAWKFWPSSSIKIREGGLI